MSLAQFSRKRSWWLIRDKFHILQRRQVSKLRGDIYWKLVGLTPRSSQILHASKFNTNWSWEFLGQRSTDYKNAIFQVSPNPWFTFRFKACSGVKLPGSAWLDQFTIQPELIPIDTKQPILYRGEIRGTHRARSFSSHGGKESETEAINNREGKPSYF